MVNVASTLANATEFTSVQWRQKDGTRIEVYCPLSVALYNRYMGGVDHGDQLQGSYSVHLKVYKKIINTYFGSYLTHA